MSISVFVVFCDFFCEYVKDANRVVELGHVHQPSNAIGVLDSYLVRTRSDCAHGFAVVGHQSHLHPKQLLTKLIPDGSPLLADVVASCTKPSDGL